MAKIVKATLGLNKELLLNLLEYGSLFGQYDHCVFIIHEDKIIINEMFEKIYFVHCRLSNSDNRVSINVELNHDAKDGEEVEPLIANVEYSKMKAYINSMEASGDDTIELEFDASKRPATVVGRGKWSEDTSFKLRILDVTSDIIILPSGINGYEDLKEKFYLGRQDPDFFVKDVSFTPLDFQLVTLPKGELVEFTLNPSSDSFSVTSYANKDDLDFGKITKTFIANQFYVGESDVKDGTRVHVTWTYFDLMQKMFKGEEYANSVNIDLYNNLDLVVSYVTRYTMDLAIVASTVRLEQEDMIEFEDEDDEDHYNDDDEEE